MTSTEVPKQSWIIQFVLLNLWGQALWSVTVDCVEYYLLPQRLPQRLSQRFMCCILWIYWWYTNRVCLKSTDPITTDQSNYNRPTIIGYPIVIRSHGEIQHPIGSVRFLDGSPKPTGTDRTGRIYHRIKNWPTLPILIELPSNTHPITNLIRYI